MNERRGDGVKGNGREIWKGVYVLRVRWNRKGKGSVLKSMFLVSEKWNRCRVKRERKGRGRYGRVSVLRVRWNRKGTGGVLKNMFLVSV